MNYKSKRNELLITLADINELIETLEGTIRVSEKATDEVHQLLKCYELKVDILKIIWRQ